MGSPPRPREKQSACRPELFESARSDAAIPPDHCQRYESNGSEIRRRRNGRSVTAALVEGGDVLAYHPLGREARDQSLHRRLDPPGPAGRESRRVALVEGRNDLLLQEIVE